MRRRFKLLAVLVGVLTVFIVVAAIVLPMLVDSAYYRREVITQVKELTGHDLHVDGKIRLHVFPRLRLTVTDIRIANPPGFSTPDLARLPWLAVDVKWLALVAGRVEAQAIALSGLSVNLERDQDGRGNWEPTLAVERSGNGAKQAVTGTPLAAMAVGELSIRDATFHWRDQSSNELISVPAISLQTGALQGGKGIDDVRLRVTLPEGDASIEVRGDAILSGAGRRLLMPALTATFHRLAIAGLRMDGTMSTRLTADIEAQRLNLDTVRLSARATGSEDQRIAVEITTALGFDLARQRLTENTLSAKVPAYSLAGITGDLELSGLLSGDLEAGTYAFENMQGSGIMGGEALADAGVAFALGGTLNADSAGRSILARGLEIAGSIDGDRLPFRLNTDLELAPRTRTLATTDMRLSVRDWRVDGTMTLRSVASPSGVQGVLDVRIQDQALAGSFAVSESEADSDGVDVRMDVVADLDIADAAYALRGRNAVVLRVNVNRGPTYGSWRLDDVNLGARLNDASFPGGELTLKLQADMDVNVSDEVVRSNNLRVTVDESRITGSVNIRRFAKPAVRIDLQADRIDADRYLPPVAAGADNMARATPIAASVEAIRALDFSGELRVKELMLKGMQLEDVRLTARGVAGDG